MVREDRDEVGVGLEEEVRPRPDPLRLAVATEDEGVDRRSSRSVTRHTLSIWNRALFIANGGLWLSVFGGKASRSIRNRIVERPNSNSLTVRLPRR